MLFNSFNFWLIFPIIFVCYWLIPIKYKIAKKWFLIITSYLLYMNWKPSFALILLGITLITFYGAQNIDGKKKKSICYSVVSITLLPLIIFKYYNFINDSIYHFLDIIGLHFTLPGLNYAVPVGISFFTFQALSYFWDVYYGKEEPEKKISSYILFCSFFPQTASGPISKSKELLPQINNPKPFNYQQGVEGLKYLLLGMFMKCVVADRLGLYVDTVYNNYTHYSGSICFLASIAYSFQIYSDFAGYSFMAIGIARTLGFNLVNNFNQPYFSATITEFWKKWHISLTRWLTEYIYIPLGGSRCSKAKCYRNIIVTFLISGLWHGANWTFIMWGAIHGFLQIIEKFLNIQKSNNNNIKVKCLRGVITFLMVNLAWIFFRMPSIQDAFCVIRKIITNFDCNFILYNAHKTDQLLCVVAILTLLLIEFKIKFIKDKFKIIDSKPFRFITYIILFCMILSIGVLDAGSFIYVSF